MRHWDWKITPAPLQKLFQQERIRYDQSIIHLGRSSLWIRKLSAGTNKEQSQNVICSSHCFHCTNHINGFIAMIMCLAHQYMHMYIIEWHITKISIMYKIHQNQFIFTVLLSRRWPFNTIPGETVLLPRAYTIHIQVIEQALSKHRPNIISNFWDYHWIYTLWVLSTGYWIEAVKG